MFIGGLQRGYSGQDYSYGKSGAAPHVNPTNATYDEMMLLVNDFIEQGKVEEGAFDFIKKPEDLNQRFDYLAEARAWKRAQRDFGEMVGYYQVLQACNAMCNFIFEPAYIETETGMERVQYMEGELTSGILGLGGCGNGSFYAQYASNSTAANPIVEIRVATEGGIGEEVYYVDINSVNPKHATELEMFALLLHYEKQGTAGKGIKLYSRGTAEDIFNAQTMTEFLFEKKNWLSRLEEFGELEISEILQEIFRKIEEARAESEEADGVFPKEDAVNMLLAESISCTYPAADRDKEAALYVISCDAQGVRCSKAGEPGLVWEIKFTDASQYQRVVDYMHSLNTEDDLSFACLEEFWRDFLGEDNKD